MFEEVTASSLVKVDMSGNPVGETPFITNAAGFTIHSALHMAREDAQAVMHLHTPHGQAVSAHSEGLLPLTQTAMLIREDVRSEEHTSELQSLMRISYAVFCLKKNKT